LAGIRRAGGFSYWVKTSHRFNLRAAPGSAVAAATALKYRSGNNPLQFLSHSQSWNGGSIAATLQDACGKLCAGDIIAGTGWSASQIEEPRPH
jgi:hypothetical protein